MRLAYPAAEVPVLRHIAALYLRHPERHDARFYAMFAYQTHPPAHVTSPTISAAATPDASTRHGRRTSG